MTPLLNFQWFAAKAFDQLMFSLVAGGVLIATISLVLRLLSKKNSRTRFAVWFSTLIAIAVLPLLRAGWQPHLVNSGHANAIVTIPSAWATYFTLIWAVVAGAGFIRLVAGLWSVERLRRGAKEIDPRTLGRELHEVITEFRHRRRVSILVSERAEVPGAIGFLRPAIMLPAWLVEDPQSADVKYVVLHEMAHLERWDDWTNLLQRLVKALLFFHPGVWWIERKLYLDREMACDDVVLARTASARSYAQCLARVAEKSFLRRQLALATAAVDRLGRLSQRLARILDDHHPRSARSWKPAIPMVAVIASLCAISVSRTPDLVQLSDSASSTAAVGSHLPSSPQVSLREASQNQDPPQKAEQPARSFDAALGSRRASVVPVRCLPTNSWERNANICSKAKVRKPGRPEPSPRLYAASYEPEASADGVFIVLVTNQEIQSPGAEEADSQVLQIKVWEVRWIVPETRPTKQIPRKT